MVRRVTNRQFGTVRPLDPALVRTLHAGAAAVGATVHLVTDRDRVGRVADLLAASDRVRFLTPHLHRQMMDEMRWPGADRAADGIDVHTLGMDAADLAKLEVATRSDVMAELAGWGDRAGAALGDGTRDRINASSAIAVLTVDDDRPADYVRGGMALEHLWVAAERHGLAVHPVSPVFLYARDAADRRALSVPFAGELGELQRQFGVTVGLGTSEVPILVLRLSHDAPAAAVRSQRLDRTAILAETPAGSLIDERTNGRNS